MSSPLNSSFLFFLIVTPLSVHQLVLCGLLTVHRRVLRDDHAWVNPQNTLNITSFAQAHTHTHSPMLIQILHCCAHAHMVISVPPTHTLLSYLSQIYVCERGALMSCWVGWSQALRAQQGDWSSSMPVSSKDP